ncbi:hypothetical protein BIW11_08879 [Tropilaelaps mercedesae]|uniref:Uncharacterized protein n=1 Tax=Tropilaelaps mercedesae TaxID=418985 RepID=A0A1V9XMJ6_9ACAR|nr:hypothetical protein BIW11_08879 [Tropilaelaps mercedesae]
MLQRSQSNKNTCLNMEFQRSMLRKLHTLQSSSIEDSLSSLSCNFLSSVSSSTTSSSRRRHFYQSPGLAYASSPSVPETGVPRERMRSLASVLEERAQLVRKNLTLNSLNGHMCSTPVSFTTSKKLNTAAVGTIKQNTLKDLSRVTGQFNDPIPDNHSAVSKAALTTLHTPPSKRHKPNSLMVSKREKRSGSLYRNQRLPARLRKSGSLGLTASLEDIKLEQLSFKLDKGRLSREAIWIQLTCTLIKNLVSQVPLCQDDMFKCRCLQIALGATKVVDPVAGDNWLSEFSDRITDLIQEVNKCSFHTQLSRSYNRNKKLNVERAETVCSDETWTNLMAWLRSARPHLLERLTQNIQMLA